MMRHAQYLSNNEITCFTGALKELYYSNIKHLKRITGFALGVV